MSKRITIEELQSYLWNSAVLLRTSIDAGAYKQYIFPLLFFKRICDVYDEECAQILEEYDGDEEALEWEENHRFNVPKGAHWKDVRSVTENIGVAIVEAFRKIENANSDQLQGIFGDGAWTNKNRLPDRLLKDLIEHFSTKTLSIANCPEDELGQGYEFTPLLSQLQDLKNKKHTGNQQYMDIQKETAKLKEQLHVLARLKTKGFIDEEKYITQSTELSAKIEKLNTELRKLSQADDEDEVIDRISELAAIIENGTDLMTQFDEILFESIVEKIIVMDQNTLEFHLHGGLRFTEKI